MREKVYDKSALIRCTEGELAQLHRRAAATNLSLSRFLVKSALTDNKVPMADEREEIKQLRFEIRKIGVNLNQIAHQINAGRNGAGEMPSLDRIEEIQNLIETTLKILLQKL